jgi:deazaflavin-dependent oxidoreductase (nitroreductase family)
MTATPNIRWLIKGMSSVNRFWFRATGGRIGGKIGGVPILLLTTTGRRSGASRTAPLMYLEDAGRFVVVASNAGDDRHPAWWLNLRKTPQAEVEIGTRRLRVRGRQASTDEHAKLWPKLVALYSAYDVYRTRTRREIPVVVLERA